MFTDYLPIKFTNFLIAGGKNANKRLKRHIPFFLFLWTKSQHFFFKIFVLIIAISISTGSPYSFQSAKKNRQAVCLLLPLAASLFTDIFKAIPSFKSIYPTF